MMMVMMMMMIMMMMMLVVVVVVVMKGTKNGIKFLVPHMSDTNQELLRSR